MNDPAPDRRRAIRAVGPGADRALRCEQRQELPARRAALHRAASNTKVRFLRVVGITPLLGLLALAATARAEIEFSGVLTMSGRTLFALTDTATARSDWVALQGRFAEHVVSHYDQPSETLTLTRREASIRVRLKDDAKVQPTRFELTGRISFGAGETVEIARATLNFDQENVFPLKDGITYRIIPVRRTDGTIRYSISIEERTAANRIHRLSAPSIVTLPHQSFIMRIGDFAFSFTPK